MADGPRRVPRMASGKMWTSTTFWVPSGCGMAVMPTKTPCFDVGDRLLVDGEHTYVIRELHFHRRAVARSSHPMSRRRRFRSCRARARRPVPAPPLSTGEQHGATCSTTTATILCFIISHTPYRLQHSEAATVADVDLAPINTSSHHKHNTLSAAFCVGGLRSASTSARSSAVTSGAFPEPQRKAAHRLMQQHA